MSTTIRTTSEKQMNQIRRFILRRLGFFEVGDAVYYKAPKPSYAVRKSTVVEVVTYAQNFNQNGYLILCHWNRSCPWDIRVFGGQKGFSHGWSDVGGSTFFAFFEFSAKSYYICSV
jgi:hypothetical protein